jgi:hypothetical protein
VQTRINVDDRDDPEIHTQSPILSLHHYCFGCCDKSHLRTSIGPVTLIYQRRRQLNSAAREETMSGTADNIVRELAKENPAATRGMFAMNLFLSFVGRPAAAAK